MPGLFVATEGKAQMMLMMLGHSVAMSTAKPGAAVLSGQKASPANAHDAGLFVATDFFLGVFAKLMLLGLFVATVKLMLMMPGFFVGTEGKAQLRLLMRWFFVATPLAKSGWCFRCLR